MSEKGIMVSDAATGEVVACRDAVETDESSNTRIIQRVDVCKGKLWSTTRSATPTASVETGEVSFDASVGTIADNALTVGDASTLVVVPEFSYNFTQSADITPVVLAKDTDTVVGVLETKTVSMTKEVTPYIVEQLTESDFDIRSEGYIGADTEADSILEVNWGPLTLKPGNPSIRTKMEFDKFMTFPFTVDAGTYTFVYRSGVETYPTQFSLALSFYELDGTPLSPTYVDGYDFDNLTGSWASYTFAVGGTYLVCFDGDYQTSNNDDVHLTLIPGDMSYWEYLVEVNMPLIDEQKHDDTAVRYSMNKSTYKAIKVNIVEVGTYEFTLNNAELPAGTGDLVGYLLDTDKQTVLVDGYDNDTPDSNWEIFTHAITVVGVYYVVVKDNANGGTVDVTIENTTGSETGELVGPDWTGEWVPEEGDDGRFLAPIQTWDVSGAYRIGLMITDLDAGPDDSEVKLWGDII